MATTRDLPAGTVCTVTLSGQIQVKALKVPGGGSVAVDAIVAR